MYGRLSKLFIIVLLATVSFVRGEFDHDVKILALRIDFVADNHDGTSGNGKFLLSSQVSDCGNYTVDPPPHDKSYFESQLIALDNYFRSVSKGQFGIDLDNSDIFPSDSELAYTMPDSMSYYHPFMSDLSQEEKNALYEERIVELFSNALITASEIDNILTNQYDLIVVFHAGVSQDFDFGLDITVEDIPSAYIDYQMISDHIGTEGINVDNAYVKSGIILPETQNHLLYPEMVEYFKNNISGNICNYQYGLTGTFAMLVGQAIGLPPLWNTETGASGIGVFGLMDQGSNNGQGLIPAPPIAWNREFLRWEDPETIIHNNIIEIESRPAGKTLKVDIDDDEYLLIENRTNWFRSNVDIDSVRRVIYNKTDTIPNIIEIIFDSVGVEKDENGVVISVPDYDIGLPGSGLLIWHIDDSIISDNIQSNSINNNPKYKGIDLEEAGGAQDIGYISAALFRDPSIGEPFDMWYQGNPEYDEVNSNIKGNPLEFSSLTYPNTNSNRGASSHIKIGMIGYASDKMQITISNDLTLSSFHDTSLNILYHTDITGDGNNEFIGGSKMLWWSDTKSIEKNEFYELPSTDNLFVMTNINNNNNLVVLSDLGDSLKMFWFEYYQRFVVKRDSMMYAIPKLTSHLAGSFKSDEINIIHDSPEILLINTTSGSNISVEIPFEGGIIIGEQPIAFNDIEFQYISAIDLDLDGTIEILALDIHGKLYAYNQNYTFSTGFPITEVAIPPILAKNIIGDERPEIVFQNNGGEIIILNNVGELQYKLTNHKNSRLRMLSECNNRNIIITKSTIWSFDEVKPTNGNEWSMYHHDEINSNIIEIDYVKETTNSEKLIDIKRTYVYPNPVRDGNAKIRVFNYSADKINLKIYDAAGYFIDEIQSNIDVKNGVWETEWDVSNVESGIYLIKLRATNQNHKELTILKVGVIH
ncbi:MAG: T9SS type A sorting domain-containing protein [Candidatus Marinimicrobia bacterium]|nr:T9SS type A sorting domain-containing protein [Candidatus Neomarinimicrobiota bacterium]